MTVLNATPVRMGLIDNTSEITACKWYQANVTTLTFAAALVTADAIRLVVDAMTLCNETNTTAELIIQEAVPVPPADHFAQRELALRLYYVDSVGDKGYISVPGPDLAKVSLSKGDEVSLVVGAEMIALVTALQLGAVSRGGNPILITSARLVGRNN